MAKKRNGRQPHRSGRNYKVPRQKQPLEEQRRLSSFILSRLFVSEKSLTLQELSSQIQHFTSEAIHKELLDLVRKKDVIATGKKHFRLTEQPRFFSATLEKHSRGFGFAVNLEPAKQGEYLKRDPFLSSNYAGLANHGDQILIKIKRVRKDDRPEAELISVLKQGRERIIGFFRNGRKGSPPMVIPEDPRYPSSIMVENVDQTIPENCVVIVKVRPAKENAAAVSGTIIEIVGEADNIDVQMRIVIENHSLSHTFPQEAITETEKMTFSEEDYKGRLDLRDTCHYTIDGETAKDFDDAIAVEKSKNGFRLYVSIADVSFFVKPGTALDKEAYLRGTSIYFPGRVIPMLPEKLSNDLCSLRPDEDRLTFTAILDFTRKGALISKKFTKSVIRSKQRFTYTTVKALLIDKAPDLRKTYQEFLPSLECAEELARLLLQQRMQRGSIGFNLPEAEITLEENGKIASIIRRERNFAHQIIEEFMLAANEAVAALFTAADREFLYRIHEKPSLEKVKEFTSFAASMGMELPPAGEEPAPAWFGKVLTLAGGSPAEYVVNNLLLRTMQQARYSADNQGHFGLAATDYTHFTSPIRRYPDLIVHRLLEDLLLHRTQTRSEAALEEAGTHLSARERAAINAEREITDRLKLFFMEHHVGEIFSAVISGLIENAIFVELLDLFVSGSIDITLLRDDYYLFDIKRYRFIGEISGKTFTLGDRIEVKLIGVDHRARRINFAPAEFF